MLFNSWQFFVFLTVVFALYWISSKNKRWIIILIASYFFYMFEIPQYGILLLIITVVSYLSALLIGKTESEVLKRRVFAASVVLILAVLFVFKYFNFFSCTIAGIANALITKKHYDAITLNLILPVGISFYTFQAIGYVADVYCERVMAEKHFGIYAAFIAFFPQLVAGPIERSDNLLKQIKSSPSFSEEKAYLGIKLIIWGFFKKLVIADNINLYVKNVFENPHYYKGFVLLMCVVLFSFQIYCDFSGYSDIAIGVAKLFSIDLIENFKSPYLSTSLSEFWRRWHISLSGWLKDYIYIPLGGNRNGRIRKQLNRMLTFLVSGLWHGADWKFVFWGGLHGSICCVEDLTGYCRSRRFKVIRIILLFSFVSLAWILFAAGSIGDAYYIVSNMFEGVSAPLAYINDGITAFGSGRGFLMLLGINILILIGRDIYLLYAHETSKGSKVVNMLGYLTLTMIIVLFSNKGIPAEFIYFQF